MLKSEAGEIQELFFQEKVGMILLLEQASNKFGFFISSAWLGFFISSAWLLFWKIISVKYKQILRL